MLVVVLLALGRAGITDAGTYLENFAKNLFVRAGPPNGQLSGGLADVRAIEASTNALPHVHLLGRAGVGATEAHPRAIH